MKLFGHWRIILRSWSITRTAGEAKTSGSRRSSQGAAGNRAGGCRFGEGGWGDQRADGRNGKVDAGSVGNDDGDWGRRFLRFRLLLFDCFSGGRRWRSGDDDWSRFFE